jgi:hypothetical protein
MTDKPDLEAALTLLADEHHRYLYRQDGTGYRENGEKGWGFVSSTSTSTTDIYPTIREAIDAEIESIIAHRADAEQRAAKERETAETRRKQAAALRKAVPV